MSNGFPETGGTNDCALLNVDCGNSTLSLSSAKAIHSYLLNHHGRFSIFPNYFCLVYRVVGMVIIVVKYTGLLHNRVLRPLIIVFSAEN